MEYIKKINIVLSLLVLLALRSLYAYDFSQAVVFLCVSGIYSYQLYLKSRQVKPLDQQVTEELDKIKQVVSGLAAKNGFKAPSTQPEEKKRYF